jgi:hypothetical protein
MEAFSILYQHVPETLAGHRFCLRQYGIRANPLPNLAAENLNPLPPPPVITLICRRRRPNTYARKTTTSRCRR